MPAAGPRRCLASGCRPQRGCPSVARERCRRCPGGGGGETACWSVTYATACVQPLLLLRCRSARARRARRERGGASWGRSSARPRTSGAFSALLSAAVRRNACADSWARAQQAQEVALLRRRRLSRMSHGCRATASCSATALNRCSPAQAPIASLLHCCLSPPFITSSCSTASAVGSACRQAQRRRRLARGGRSRAGHRMRKLQQAAVQQVAAVSRQRRPPPLLAPRGACVAGRRARQAAGSVQRVAH